MFEPKKNNIGKRELLVFAVPPCKDYTTTTETQKLNPSSVNASVKDLCLWRVKTLLGIEFIYHVLVAGYLLSTVRVPRKEETPRKYEKDSSTNLFNASNLFNTINHLLTKDASIFRKCFECISWNIHGIGDNLTVESVVKAISYFDVIMLCDTWLTGRNCDSVCLDGIA